MLAFRRRTLINNNQTNLSRSRYFATHLKFNNTSNYFFIVDNKHRNSCSASNIDTTSTTRWKDFETRAPARTNTRSSTYLVTDFDTPKYRLQLAEQICALFERFYLLLTRQLFMFTDPFTSSLSPNPHLPRTSPISTLYCFRHFLFPSRVTFLTHWKILRGSFMNFYC